MNILEKILEAKKEEVLNLKNKFSQKSFEDSQFFNCHNFYFEKSISKKGQLNLIAEIKKASPSKGIIRENFNHIDISKIYFNNSVDAVSILTDRLFFMGDITFLKDIASIKKAPLLRKDFIIDEIQIFEAKSNGADAILLIAEILSSEQIKYFTNVAQEINLDVLLEIHSPKQLDKIDFSLNKIIGINNRNLETFNVNINTTFELLKLIPSDIITVSESGITSKNDIEKLKSKKINAVLVGEHFMKSNDIEKELQLFSNWCKNEN
ncbi:MAG: indole-3-glycerol phosphate synthase TrpC [Melioribacteraceae bacterium]|nr:indole-3-glycerol phosphate synthase TrpC [Melioribacteraceae bacterium]